MNKETIKKLIIILIIIIVIIIIALITLLAGKEGQNNNEEILENEIVEESEKVVTDEDRIEKYDFLVVQNCISTYLSNINQDTSRYYERGVNNEIINTADVGQMKKNAYSMLSREYIEKNSITEENVYEHVPKVNQKLIFIPIEMDLKSKENVNKYMVYGYVLDLQYKFIGNMYVIINLDINNKAFSIEPISEKTYKSGQIEEGKNEKVEVNSNNKYQYERLSEEDRVKQYFQNYKMMLLSNPEIAYKFLDEEYKEKSFGNIENFQKYIDENRKNILSATLEGYEAKINDEYTQYVEKDVKGKYYIFNISNKNPAEFTVMLDTYIIGFEKVKEDYENGNTKKKVEMNISRFVSAINDKNYYYAYNVLADSFKTRNFETQEDFETYVKDNFFEINEIEDGAFKEDGEYYVYDLVIADENNESTKKMTVVMQLQEEMDFVMSFSIE